MPTRTQRLETGKTAQGAKPKAGTTGKPPPKIVKKAGTKLRSGKASAKPAGKSGPGVLGKLIVPTPTGGPIKQTEILIVAHHAGGAEPEIGHHPMPTAVPSNAIIQAKAAALVGPAASAFKRIMAEMADHLGSQEAARLWLVTPSPQFETTPLDAIIGGEAEAVLAFLESHWGPGPAYA